MTSSHRRRFAAAIAVALGAVLVPFPSLGADQHDPAGTTSTTRGGLPGTTLEAQERDDGNTSVAPWLIGSGVVAAAAVGIGGLVLKRRTD